MILLIGRYLECRVKNSVTSTIQILLLRQPKAVTIFENYKYKLMNLKEAKVGQIAYIAVGEKVTVDGIIIEGESKIDNSIINGESFPMQVGIGSKVFAGSINPNGPLKISIMNIGENKVLSEMSRLIEIASQLKSRYVVLADKAASYYTPVVFITAMMTFLCWKFLIGVSFSVASLYAVSVLIITCPCALGLASSYCANCLGFEANEIKYFG